MIDHVEAVLAAGIIHRRDVDDIDEAAARIGLEKARDLNDTRKIDRNVQLTDLDRMAERGAWQRGNNRLTESVESGVVHHSALAFNRSGAPDLLLQEQDAVKQRLCGRRAARHVNIDG